MRSRNRLREQEFNAALFEHGGDKSGGGEAGERHAREIKDHGDYALRLMHQFLHVGTGRVASEDGDGGDGTLDDIHAHDEHQK